ncbi:hypothetical protein [Burkholderia territorii]|uniref:hypothetical protein n=1 Tax=Burkholderia territorii TaxID=1503055 RepID=UPI000A788CF8|nr:hypothetical protein [Burkholderia territorii]
MKITDDMLTEWFPGDVKPARRGFFQVTDPTGHALHGRWLGFQFWNGNYWEGLTYAAVRDEYRSIYQNHAWRGLKEKHHG